MTDFLLELRCQEIPARMQAGARADLEKLFRKEMEAAGVGIGEVTVWSTPRRLALIARDLPLATEAVREETKGPATTAPEQALEGFLRKTGLTKDQLEVRDLKGKDTYFAVVEKPGRAVREVLAEAIPAIIRAFPWPKSQRWGAASISTESLRWVRPLSGIVAILGEDLVECEVGGISSSYATMGHRFHHPDEITIGGAHDYADKLRACHVIVDHAERQDLIRTQAREAASAAGLTLVEDEGLVIENAGLTEWPVPLLGRFDEGFLEVPPEVIQLTARVNQKYFVCENDGKLANAFVCTANIAASDGGEAIVAGNRKVLAARLSDARFFWEQDRKTRLSEHAKKLERITFHEKLGTVADKVERVAKLARWLVEEGIVIPANAGTAGNPGAASPAVPAFAGTTADLADQAERAAGLCKADLVTEMVGEFPELQGLMGGYYARAELDENGNRRYPDTVADAIRDHYKPVGQGDEVPTAPVTVAVSLADKLDTLVGFFALDERPTGSKDPFALRRAALGILSLLQTNNISLHLEKLGKPHLALLAKQISKTALREDGPNGVANAVYSAWAEGREFGVDPASAPFIENAKGGRTLYSDQLSPMARFAIETHQKLASARLDLVPFMADRLKVQQREAGVRHDLIDAVFALGGEDDLVRLLARVHALQAFVETGDGANLLAGYKRAANILKKEGFDSTSVTPAKVGAQSSEGAMDSGLRRNDEGVLDDYLEHTGDEDPLENVDDPDMKVVYAAEFAEHAAHKGLSYVPEKAEKALIEALDAAEPQAAAAAEAEDFAGAMAALASLRKPIDAFFDEVTVNDSDPAKRTARLALLDRFRAAVHNVADFSRIEG